MMYNYLIGGNGMMLFSWLVYLLVIIVLVLSIVALVKYINKK